MKKLFIVLFLIIGVQILSAQIQSGQPNALTLDQALAIAFNRNATVAQAGYSIDIAKSSVVSAYGSYIPRLNAGASFNRTGYSTPASLRTIGGVPFNVPRQDQWYNTYNGSVGLSYTVFDGFNRESNYSLAQTNEAVAEQSYDRTRQSIGYSVISSYLNILRNEQQVKVLRENLTNEKNRLGRITEQNRLGAVAIGDVYREQSLVAQADYNLISGQVTYDKSKIDLLNLLALNVDDNYVIADASIASQIKGVESDSGVQAFGSFNELFQRALQARPDYASFKAGVSLAEDGITSAWSGYYPSVNVSAGYSTNAQTWETASRWDNHSTNFGLNLSWQLPEIFGAIQRIQNADIAKKQAVLQLEQKQRDVSVEVKKALLDLDAGKNLYGASVKAQVAAEQDKKIAEAKYNLGSGTLLDLQVANTNYLNAELTTVFNEYNYYTLKKNLELVIGEKKY